MKLQRPGYTESGLCFIDYLKSLDINEKNYETFLIKWLYSTSGFYDKSITSYECDFNIKKFHPKYCKIEYEEVINSEIFNFWLSSYKNSLFNCEHLIFCLHSHISNKYDSIKQKYLATLLPKQNNLLKHFWTWHHNLYDIIKDKKVLIVNGMADTICSYYLSGKTHNLMKDFPKIETIPIVTPYSFFNNGPHKNFKETLENVYEKIIEKNFDIAIISYGSYGCILADMIEKNLNKDAITIGSGLNKMFDLKNIDITKQTLPENFKLIENGRYWNFETT